MFTVLLLGCVATEDGGAADGDAADSGAEDTAATDPWDAPIDYEALCAGIWPENECADGCADSEVEASYEQGFWTYAAAETGFSEEELHDRIRLRRVETAEAQQSSLTEVDYLVRVGWAQVRYQQQAQADGGRPSEDEIVAAFSRYDVFPKPDWDATTIPLDVAKADVAACEVELDVDFPDTGWCDGYVTNEAEQRDPRMHFTFLVYTSSMTFAYASVYPGGELPTRCDVGSDTVD